MALTKGFIQNAATTPLDARFFEAGLLQKNADNSVRTGQLWGGAVSVQATASMTVTIADGTYWVVSRGLSDGGSVLANVGTATVTIPAAPASNSQYHSVYVKQNDSTFGDADSAPFFGVVSGTAAGSPTIPAVPTGATRLATVLVPAGVTATNASGVVISNTYQFTALSVAPIRYRSFSEMVADTANVVEGANAYIKSAGLYYLRAGIWHRTDQIPFVIISQGTAQPLATGTSPVTLGGPAAPSSYQSSDTQFFDVRTDGVALVKVAGWYEVSGAVVWSNSSTGQRYLGVTQGDTDVTPPVGDLRAASGTSNQTVSGQMYLNAGDFVKLKGYQSSGGTINYQSRLTVKLLSV